MKKIFVLLIATIIGFTMMSGFASAAGSLTLTGDQSVTVAALDIVTAPVNRPTYYPAEAVAAAAVVPNNIRIDLNTGALDATMPAAVALVGGAVPKSIIYIPSTNLPSGTRIVFTLTNGTWQGTTFYLLKQNLPTFEGITVASADSVSAGVLTFIVGSTPIDAGTIMILSPTQDTTVNPLFLSATNPTIKMNSTLATAGTKVTLAVTECYDAVGPIAGGLASAIPIVGAYQQFVWTRVAGTGTINVNSPDLRKLFLGSSATPGTAGTLRLQDVQATVPIDSSIAGSVANFAVNLAAGAGLASLDYTITGNQLTKLTAVNGLILDMDGGGANNKAFTVASDTNATLTIDTSDNAAWYNATASDVIFTVAGVQTLDVQNFNVVANLNFTNNTLYNDVPLASGSIMAWDINGWQSTVPYMWAAATQAEDTFIKIFNNSTVAGEVLADVTSDDGTIVATNVAVGNVAAGTVGIFWAADIAALAGITVPGPFAIVFTVNAPVDSVTAFANQKRPNGVDRVIPVYTGTAGTYKNW